MIAIPNMEKPKHCGECDLWSNCFYPKNPYTEQDDYIAPDCPLIEIDENNPMLLEFLNEFDKWRAYKEVMNYIKSVYKEGEANDIR